MRRRSIEKSGKEGQRRNEREIPWQQNRRLYEETLEAKRPRRNHLVSKDACQRHDALKKTTERDEGEEEIEINTIKNALDGGDDDQMGQRLAMMWIMQ